MMTAEEIFDRDLSTLRTTTEPFIEWCTAKGHPEVAALLDRYMIEQLIDTRNHFCLDCRDTGYVWVEGYASVDNPEGDFQVRCSCATNRQAVFGDESYGIQHDAEIPY